MSRSTAPTLEKKRFEAPRAAIVEVSFMLRAGKPEQVGSGLVGGCSQGPAPGLKTHGAESRKE
jgi:hypothetical protein